MMVLEVYILVDNSLLVRVTYPDQVASLEYTVVFGLVPGAYGRYQFIAVLTEGEYCTVVFYSESVVKF